MTTAEQVRQEEREAREQHRHMERMRREAEAKRLAEAKAAAREHGRQRRERVEVAERAARDLCRTYSRALAAANVRSRRPFPDELDRACDNAYANAMAACNHARRLRGA